MEKNPTPVDEDIEYYFVGIDAPESTTVDEALRLAKEAIQEAGFEVRDVELDDSWVQHDRLSIVANIDIRGGIFAGRHSWEYCKDGVTVQAEWP